MNHNSIEARRETAEELAERLGLTFKDLRLLNRAFTHRSYLNEHLDALEDNERLEFLGDAVLDFMVGAWLYHHCPEMPEGDLTRMRSALVHTEKLAEFARKLDLGGAIRLGRGETQSGGNRRDALLCDTFEALVGAIYVDGGIDRVSIFIDPILETAADDLLVNQKIDDPKSLFQEWAQAQLFYTPKYVTINVSGPDHSREFEVDVTVNDAVYGSGKGTSKHAATKAAAQDALNRLGIVSSVFQNTGEDF